MSTVKQKYTLPRRKSLKSKKLIDDLFVKGKSLVAHPLRLVYLPVDFSQDEIYLVTFSVSKRKIKRAVDRNRIKRLMRESFRFLQYEINLPEKTIMMWIYTGKELPDSQTVKQRMIEIIKLYNKKATQNE